MRRWAVERLPHHHLAAGGTRRAVGCGVRLRHEFDEVVLSLFIQSPYLQTLPVRMYSSVTRDTDPTIAAAATLILALTTSVTVIASIYATRRNRVR